MEILILPITIVIPTFERPESLKDTLASLNSFNYKADEILIIDQSKKYRTDNMLECSKYKNTKYVWTDIPSLTRARNIGLREAKNNIIVFSDDDINIFSTTLYDLWTIMKDPNYALVGGLDFYTSRRKSSFFSYMVCKKSFSKRRIGHMTKSIFGRYPDNITEETPTEWAMGYFFSVKKNICLENNLFFDENLKKYAYAEDLDFTYRYCSKVKTNGLKSILTPKVTVHHKVSTEYRTPTENFIKYLFLNRGYIANKLNIRGSNLAMKWANFFIVLDAIRRGENLQYYKNAQKLLKEAMKKDFKNFNSF